MYEIKKIIFSTKDMCNDEFYEKTGLNFEFQSVQIFHGGRINSYLDMEKFEELNITCCLYQIGQICLEDDLDDIDWYSEELYREITGDYARKYKHIYTVVRVSNPKDDRCELLKKYISQDRILYQLKENQDLYVVDGFVQESRLQWYIDGYIFSNCDKMFDVKKINFCSDLSEINRCLDRDEVFVCPMLADDAIRVLEVRKN